MAIETSQKKAFVVGAGFIGLHVIEELLKAGYRVSALTRRAEHATQLSKTGVLPVMGSLDDLDLITMEASRSHVVIHTATADHIPSARAILNGIEQRAERGLETAYIHNSGTGVLHDGAAGSFKGNKVFTDENRDDVDTVPDANPHRDVDNMIVSRQREIGRNAKIAIMIPPLIYGYNERHGRLSIQIPALTRYALKHGSAGHVGAGQSVWSTVHVKDLAKGYVVLLRHMQSAPSQEFLSNPYVFCENTGDNEPSWRDMAVIVGKGLHAAGKIPDAEPKTIPSESYGDCLGAATPGIVGMNSRSRAIRLRALGWEPVEKSWDRSFLEDELPAILNGK